MTMRSTDCRSPATTGATHQNQIMKHTSIFLASVLGLCSAPAAENLLRNGSFEGGTLYWHQVKAPEQMLVPDAKVGEFALRIAKGNVMSAPFVAERGQAVTVSFLDRKSVV